jgi:phosphoglycerate dehydrogenase-like enzyme
LLVPEIKDITVPLTALRGVHNNPLADFTIAAILHHVKQLPRLETNRIAKVFDRFPMTPVKGSNMVIIGYGDIG